VKNIKIFKSENIFVNRKMFFPLFLTLCVFSLLQQKMEEKKELNKERITY